MKILMVASEATPFAKTGGLADVLGVLPAALQQRGATLGVVLPLHRQYSPEVFQVASRAMDRVPLHFAPGKATSMDILRLERDGVNWFFIDAPDYFDRPGLYGEGGVDYPDNHLRFGALCRGALSVVRSLFRPDILHCHDWQAALIGPMLQDRFRTDPTFIGVPVVLTVHNLGYQGIFPPSALQDLGLSPSLFHPGALEFYGKVNLLKGGLVFADAITTVSPTYAREIQTPEYGMGLDGLLRARASVLTGIVNGVDYSDWSPEVDPHIAANYAAEDLSGKALCKRELLDRCGLDTSPTNRPLIGIVSRFVGQKGFDLVTAIAGQLLSSEDVAIVALGNGEPQYEIALTDLAAQYPDRVHVRVAYDNALAHQIEAGADIFLMPSRYEPCGLNQIYSLRYGTIPVVRATGGLEDTVDEETGFRFRDYTTEALLSALRQAIAAYGDRPAWQRRMRTCMSRNWSWDASAARYLDLYRRLIERA